MARVPLFYEDIDSRALVVSRFIEYNYLDYRGEIINISTIKLFCLVGIPEGTAYSRFGISDHYRIFIDFDGIKFELTPSCYVIDDDFLHVRGSEELGDSHAFFLPRNKIDEIRKFLPSCFESPPCTKNDNLDVYNKIAGTIVEGAEKFSYGLQSVSRFIDKKVFSPFTSYVKENTSPEPEPVENLNKMVEVSNVAKVVLGSTASVSGYLANKVGVGVGKVGRTMAPYVKDGLCKAGVDKGMTQGIIVLVAGLAEASGTVMEGVSEASTVVGSSIASNTVVIVEHKYGKPMATVTENSFDAIGSAIKTSSNLKCIKKSYVLNKCIKETGKAMVTEESATSMDTPSVTKG